jgi:hypothetical protein
MDECQACVIVTVICYCPWYCPFYCSLPCPCYCHVLFNLVLFCLLLYLACFLKSCYNNLRLMHFEMDASACGNDGTCPRSYYTWPSGAGDMYVRNARYAQNTMQLHRIIPVSHLLCLYPSLVFVPLPFKSVPP